MNAHAALTFARQWWPLSALFFLYMAAMGAMGVYWPLWLAGAGASESFIGMVFGVRTLIGVLSQPGMSWLSDRTGRPAAMIRGSVLWVTAGSLLLPWLQTPWAIAAVVWLMAPCDTATLPLLDSHILRRLPATLFGRVRLWGSIGYGVTVSTFGWWSQSWSPDVAGRASVWLFMGVYAVASAIVWFVSDRMDARPVTAGPMLRPGVAPSAGRIDWGVPLALLLTMSALHFTAVTVYNVLLSLHAVELGFSTAATGAAVGTAICCEVVLLAFSTRLLRGRSDAFWLALTFVVSAVRWVVTATSTWAPLWSGINALHFFSFGVWYVVTMRMLGDFAPADRRTTLQGVFSSVVLGIGGTVGMVAGGALMQWGGGRAAFFAAAGAEALSLVLLAALVRSRR